MARQRREVIGTGQIRTLLMNRYAAPAWALLHEVRNATGYQRSVRTADAVAMSLWPSRGLELHGFEIKASRGDLRKELEDPSKAEEIMQYCDRWWLVVGHKDLIQPGELPPTWGLLVAQKNRLVAKVEAPKLESKTLDRLFIASVLRNFTECYVPRSHLNDMVDAKYKEWVESDKDSNDFEKKKLRMDLEALNKTINLFEEASGVNIRDRWQTVKIGEAVRYVMRRDYGSAKEQLKRLHEQASQIARSAELELETLTKLEEMDDRSD